mmetsp:Transcript_88445/g.222611  ORF Transcript_88445/g.222611 Transcript_88445/m.222611 type:complete len:322 (+) Transcript_88445:1077-2042(+)
MAPRAHDLLIIARGDVREADVETQVLASLSVQLQDRGVLRGHEDRLRVGRAPEERALSEVVALLKRTRPLARHGGAATAIQDDVEGVADRSLGDDGLAVLVVHLLEAVREGMALFGLRDVLSELGDSVEHAEVDLDPRRGHLRQHVPPPREVQHPERAGPCRDDRGLPLAIVQQGQLPKRGPGVELDGHCPRRVSRRVLGVGVRHDLGHTLADDEEVLAAVAFLDDGAVGRVVTKVHAGRELMYLLFGQLKQLGELIPADCELDELQVLLRLLLARVVGDEHRLLVFLGDDVRVLLLRSPLKVALVWTGNVVRVGHPLLLL